MPAESGNEHIAAEHRIRRPNNNEKEYKKRSPFEVGVKANAMKKNNKNFAKL